MPTVLMSPTEPIKVMSEELGKIGFSAITSSIPEERGADYLMFTHNGSIGIQRKEIPYDFLSSVIDGRLARETSLLENVNFKWVVCEGKFRFFDDGSLSLYSNSMVKAYSRFTKRSISKLIFEIKLVKGVEVDFTENTQGTAYFIKDLHDFIVKSKHTGLSNRPGCRGVWSVPSDPELDSWILQGFTGIGPTLAGYILDSFGALPLKWTCTLEDLYLVPGLNKRKAEQLWARLPIH